MNLSGIKGKIKNFIQDKIWLIIILLAGFLVRWYGIYFDYPDTSTFIWDESYNVAYLIDIITQKRIIVNPFSSPYPAFLPFLLAPTFILRILYLAWQNGLSTVDEIKDFLVGNGIGQIYIIIRWYSVFFGTATIYFIYKIFRLIFKNKYISLYASLIYAFSLLPVYLSHWGKIHMVMVAFVVLSLYFSLIFEKEKKHKYFYLCVLSAASAFSIHYIGISAIVFPALAWWQNREEISIKELVGLVLMYVVITVSCYGANFFGIRFMIQDVIKNYYSQNNGALIPTGQWERFYYVFRDSLNIEPVFVSLFFVMLIIRFKTWWQNKQIRYILAGLIFNYLLMITIMVGAHLSRWLLIFVSLAAPLGGAVLVEFLYEKKIHKFLISIILFFLVVPNLIFTLHWLGITNNYTSLKAGKWITENLDRKEIIYSFSEVFRLPFSYQAAVWNYDHNKKYRLQRKVKYIIDNEEKFKNSGYNLMYDYGNNRYDDLAGPETKYVIITFSSAEEQNRPLDNLKKFHDLKLLESFYFTEDKKILEQGIDNEYLNSPEKWTTLLKLKMSGPNVEIYEIIKN
jgi:hypothetical protein